MSRACTVYNLYSTIDTFFAVEPDVWYALTNHVYCPILGFDAVVSEMLAMPGAVVCHNPREAQDLPAHSRVHNVAVLAIALGLNPGAFVWATVRGRAAGGAGSWEGLLGVCDPPAEQAFSGALLEIVAWQVVQASDP